MCWAHAEDSSEQRGTWISRNSHFHHNTSSGKLSWGTVGTWDRQTDRHACRLFLELFPHILHPMPWEVSGGQKANVSTSWEQMTSFQPRELGLQGYSVYRFSTLTPAHPAGMQGAPGLWVLLLWAPLFKFFMFISRGCGLRGRSTCCPVGVGV